LPELLPEGIHPSLDLLLAHQHQAAGEGVADALEQELGCHLDRLIPQVFADLRAQGIAQLALVGVECGRLLGIRARYQKAAGEHRGVTKHAKHFNLLCPESLRAHPLPGWGGDEQRERHI
jgi:hypothetical protein